MEDFPCMVRSKKNQQHIYPYCVATLPKISHLLKPKIDQSILFLWVKHFAHWFLFSTEITSRIWLTLTP